MAIFKNVLSNGSLKKGLPGWTADRSVMSLVSSDIGPVMQTINTAQYGGPYYYTPLVIGHKYYGRALVKASTSTVSVGFALGVHPAYAVGIANHSGSGNFEVLSGIVTLVSTPIPRNPLAMIYDVRTSGWTAVSVSYVLVIDLTEHFGAGNEPTKIWCDANILYDGDVIYSAEDAIIDRVQNDVTNHTTKGYVNIKDMNRIDGNLVDLKNRIKKAGFSLTKLYNKITNSDFLTGLTGWTTAVTTTFSVAGGIANFLPVAWGDGIQLTNGMKTLAGHIYYSKARVYSATSGVGCGVIYAANIVNQQTDTIIANAWDYPSNYQAHSTDYENGFRVYTHLSANWVNIQVDWVLFVDLTDIFGAGNEPTKAWCDANVGFVDGTLTFSYHNIERKVAYFPNMVINPSFENASTAPWGLGGGTVAALDGTVAAFGSHSVKLAGDNASGYALVSQTPYVINGHKYYAAVYILRKASLTAANGAQFDIAGIAPELDFGTLSDATVPINTWTKFSYVNTAGTSGVGTLRLYTFHSTPIWVDGFTLIDLTDIFGAGNEPSKEWCDANIDFFGGVIVVSYLGALDNPQRTTLVNRFSQGSFEDATYFTMVRCSLSAEQQRYGTYAIKIIGDNIAQEHAAYASVNYPSVFVGHVYYVCLEYLQTILATVAGAVGIYLGGYDILGSGNPNSVALYADLTKVNEWRRASTIFTPTYNVIFTDCRFGHMFGNVYNGTIFVDGAMLIDLTVAFGVGNEPTQAWCDANIDFGELSTELNLFPDHTQWTLDDLVLKSEVDRIRKDITLLRACYHNYKDSPNLPDVSSLTWQTMNDIEYNIYLLDKALDDSYLMAEYSGVDYCGG